VSSSAKKIRVLLAEDHAVVRKGLKLLITAEPDFEIAGETDNGRKAVELAKRVRPNVVLMDLVLAGMDGYEATLKIIRGAPGTKVLVLSSYGDDDSVRKMMEAGASGYLTKHTAAQDLLHAIREVDKGNAFFSPAIAQRLRQQVRAAFVNGQKTAKLGQLSARETEVLKLVGEGLANKQIASSLSLSTKTVEKHRQQVMNKLNIHDVAGLTRYAVSHGLVSAKPEPPTRS
jgi:DNA-binding NarL/FixJ family response regulator